MMHGSRKAWLTRSAALLVPLTIGLAPAGAAAQTTAAAPLNDHASPNDTATLLDGTAQNSASAGDQSAAAVEDIVVTATRRSANLQNVSATIEAVSASTLKAFNVTGVNQLTTLVSGFVVVPSGANNLYLRGIGSNTTGYNEAQSAVYIDGVYLANPAVGIYSFNNVDRIEVLKGPQGTLYGRNVTGGLVSVITRDPGSKTAVDAALGYGNYNTLTLNFYGSTPLSDTLSANVAVFHQKQGDGYGTNILTGNDNLKSDETGFEGKVLWRPTSRTRVMASFIYDYNRNDRGYGYEVLPGTVGQDGTTYQGRYRNTLRVDPYASTQIYIGSIKVQQDLDFASLSSITAYQTSHAHVLFAALPIIGQPIAGQSNVFNTAYEQNKTFTQEFQLTSTPSSSRFDWVLGAYYYNDHTEIRLDQRTTCVGTVCAPGFVPTRNDGRPDTLSGSVYADGTYRFLPHTRLTVGLRYTRERKTLSGLVSPLPGQPDSVTALPASTVIYPGQPFVATVNGVSGLQPGIPTKQTYSKLTYRFVLAQDIGDNVHLYASHNLGFKSGAYNANVFTNPPVQPELLYATEAGIKSELFDRRLRLNLSYFHYAYKNVQVRSLAPPAPVGLTFLQNVASERTDGVDADFSIVPFAGMTINGSAEYLDAKYVDYPGNTCITPTGTRVVNGVTVGTISAVLCNVAGNRVANAPPFSASLGFVYRFATSFGSWALSGNDHYNHRYPKVPDLSIYDNAHHILDASLTWTSLSKRFDVNLWARNLANEYVYAVAQTSTSLLIVPGAPRTFGATVGVHF